MSPSRIFQNKRPDYLNRVYTMKKCYDGYLPLKCEEASKIRELDRIKEVHLSNLVEGNTYTYDETYVLLEKGIPSVNRTLKESLEISNLNKAIEFSENYEGELTELFIKECHGIMSAGCLNDYKDEGNYRKVRNWVGDINTCYPNSINKEMKLLIAWYTDNVDKLDLILLAIRFKYRLVCIHPFIDGNGRVSRVVMNWMFRHNSICPFNIYKDLVPLYYTCLSESNKETGEYNGKFTCKALEEFICRCLVRKYEEYIRMLENDFE